MNEYIGFIRRFFSIETVIYLAILIITLTSMIRCFVPVTAASRRLRKGARVIIIENKQNKERKSWRDIQFLGSRLETIWADFLQNAEMREAHHETCDVSQYVNEESILYAVGSTSLADLVPGLVTSLGILGTFLGLVQGLSGLKIDAENTQMLLSAMEKLIAGMSTAFLTSIAGVSASLLFSLMNNHCLSKCRRSIDRFCDVFSLYAMPKPASEETESLALQFKTFKALQQLSDEASEKIGKQVEASITRALLPVQRSMDNFIISATQAQVEGIDQVVQLFIRRLNVTLDSELAALKHSLSENRTEQQMFVKELEAATQAVDEMSRDVINMHQMSQGLLEHFQAYVSQVNDSIEYISGQQRLAQDTLDAYGRQQEQQQRILKAMREAQSGLEELMNAFGKISGETGLGKAERSEGEAAEDASECMQP